ncbi:MAG: LysM peptidoglycan-binding domain-containing protein [Saprospiraceae bacterium]|nr:LysM peptidoglycan-binding domain-containing protein [Saprospiraceae bacterium]
MRQATFTFLTFLSVLPVLNAQSPLYIQFNPECTNQLEYQYTYTEQNLLMYSIPKGASELYFFVISNKDPLKTTYLPAGAVMCQHDEINATLIDNINAGGRLAYMVFKVQNGFHSYPVESAGYIARSGTYFAFRSPNYDFVMDTASINYARNLSRPGVASPVYLTGRRGQDCQQLYAFRLEPTRPDAPRADVEVVPSIGIISDRTGRNGSEMEQNIYRLLRVNGMNLDDYIYATCHTPANNEDGTATFITRLPTDATNPNDPNSKPYNPFAEPDKETFHTKPPEASGNAPLVNCPTPPGYGYHVVQPGDSLASIARAYNVDRKLLLLWNKLQDPAQIKVCDKIWVTAPPEPTTPATTGPRYHEVQKGETLFGIARKYNVTVANIKHWNKLQGDDIQAGQQLALGPLPAQTTTGIPANHTLTPPATSAPPNPATLPPGRLMHKALAGETLNDIAWKYGYTTPYLRHINRTNKNMPPGNDDRLQEGTLLVVSDGRGEREDLLTYSPPVQHSQAPTPPSVKASGMAQGSNNTPFSPPAIRQPSNFEYVGEYIVQSGDTLASIAQRYGISPEKLAAANNLATNQEPTPRSILKIPK